MKAIKIMLAGRERYLAFTGEAMFKINDEFGGTSNLMDKMKPNTREALAIIVRAAVILAEAGELARRYMGHDPEPILDGEALLATITPTEITPLKLAIPAAITLGFGREIAEENDVVDLGLQELNAQKKRTDPGELSSHGNGGGLVREGNASHDAGRSV